VERLSTEAERLQWRRSKVLELSSQGRSQPQIASTLQVGLATVNRDLQYLRQRAKQNIRRYIDERLPLEYEKCLVGLEGILAKTWDVANNEESSEKDKLQAISIGIQAYSMKMDLLTSATVVERAVQFVDRNRGIIGQNDKVRIDVTAKQSLSQDKDDITESEQAA
jgi:hypothetical protein